MLPMRLHRNEDGQAVAFFVAILVLIFGFMAFAVDIGFLFHARRLAQNAADSAALAGASELSGCGDSLPYDPIDTANTYALRNLAGKTFSAGDDTVSSREEMYGVTDPVNGEIVPFPSVYSFVERPQSFLFARFFGLVDSPVPAEAQAVCGPILGGGVCPFAIEAPDPSDTDFSDGSYLGITLGKVYVMKDQPGVTGAENGNFQLLGLTDPGKDALRDFVSGGCDKSSTPGVELEVVVEQGDQVCGSSSKDETCIETETGNATGPVIQAFEGSQNTQGLYSVEHSDASLFPNGHKTCNVRFKLNPGLDGTLDTSLDGTVVNGDGSEVTDVAALVDSLSDTTNCDAIDAGGQQIKSLIHPAVQHRFMNIVLLDDFPTGSGTSQVLGILRMYVACWDGQDDGAGGTVQCATNLAKPPPGQVGVYGIFDTYFTPNLLQGFGLGTNPLSPKHVVLVK